MPDPPFDPQRRAMDDTFFQEQDSESFLEQLRLRLKEEAAKEDLECATGITDSDLLGRLTGLGIRADTLAALTLIPLIEVAWADDEMDAKERAAILEGAATTGIRAGGPNHALLKIWIEERPPEDLAKVWREFIAALCAELDTTERANLRENILSRTRAVAEAAGNLRRDHSMVSPEEQAVIDELETAFPN